MRNSLCLSKSLEIRIDISIPECESSRVPFCARPGQLSLQLPCRPGMGDGQEERSGQMASKMGGSVGP